MNAIAYVNQTLERLELLKGDAWAKYWVYRRMEFSRQYTPGLLFSTRLGLFFEEVLHHYKTGEQLEPIKGTELSDYDKMFNKWIVNLRKDVNFIPTKK